MDNYHTSGPPVPAASEGSKPQPLSIDLLSDIVSRAAAIRMVTELQPIGGPGDKIFPPTYEGGQYVSELRRVGDREVKTVLLDSVQSQANRMELALLSACERKEIALPLIVADFSPEFPSIGGISALEAPHRIYDAIFRDATIDGQRFRETARGQRLYDVSLQNATPLLELCPTALIFGAWDSTSLKPGYIGPKFERALVSEIVGYDATPGQKTSSRIDPLGIERAAVVYRTADGWWTADESKAERDERGKAVLYGKPGEKSKGRASLIVHGNIAPSIEDGGFTISYARQTTVLSLIALRRLHFPPDKAKADYDTDHAARMLLASLALCAITYARREGYDLRSRCVLIPSMASYFEQLGSEVSEVKRFALDTAGAAAFFHQATDRLAATKLGWEPKEISVTPSEDVLQLIRISRELEGESPNE